MYNKRKNKTVTNIDTKIKEIHQLKYNYIIMTKNVEKAFYLEEELI